MEQAIYDIAKVATPALLTLLVITGIACAKFLWNMQGSLSALKAFALELYNLHEKKIAVFEVKQSEVDETIKTHASKIENHGERIITLETRCYSTKRK